MTRETKISLLVGLAFIIVIGILLSDHFRSTQDLPRAVLADVGPTERRAMDGPEGNNPGITFAPPAESSPKETVPTQDELERQPSPVVPSHIYSNSQGDNQSATANPAPAPEDHGADSPLQDVARRNGEPIEQANIDGSTRGNDQSASPQAPAPAVAGPKEYKAQDGDTVSRMAAEFMGGNTRANRQAIIDANPSLRDDPDRVVVGKAYVIPTAAGGSTDATTDAAPSPDSIASEPGRYFYTVKEGDSLWQIANDELDDPSAVQAIKDLNSDILKGANHDVVIPGMKLRLPAKPVADSTAMN
jgi:nucleoid-associated protein YgaU